MNIYPPQRTPGKQAVAVVPNHRLDLDDLVDRHLLVQDLMGLPTQNLSKCETPRNCYRQNHLNQTLKGLKVMVRPLQPCQVMKTHQHVNQGFPELPLEQNPEPVI